VITSTAIVVVMRKYCQSLMTLRGKRDNFRLLTSIINGKHRTFGSLRQNRASDARVCSFYQRRGYALAPIICNTLNECGPDMFYFFRDLADHFAQHHFGFSPVELGQDLMSQSTDHDRDFK
jgi:hypothetical protein